MWEPLNSFVLKNPLQLVSQYSPAPVLQSLIYENRHINIPDNTQHWRIGGCSTVHLSGPTLTSLNNIHTLHLHDIDHVHLAYDFFTQYNSPLQILRLSHCTFDTLQGSLNIHAHKLKNISLEKMNWNDQIDILIQTQEGQQLDLVAIRNSNIKVLGEINLSSRYVHTFVLENNNIGSIKTGAIIQDSHETIIQGNYIGALNFLSMDTDTYNFTLQGNTIKSLALESLVVNSAILLQ
ncbi:hypothetical protein Hamer_G011450 [Homarus americanus]|uniref:Uncharacterized protein n=1 Tax=Homarus americanus TaxID=6706 RepID=A0A8J5JPQ5_HOMAM|nr:hypothetical protein Hamer_G011450 [Homarus americanus]